MMDDGGPGSIQGQYQDTAVLHWDTAERPLVYVCVCMCVNVYLRVFLKATRVVAYFVSDPSECRLKECVGAECVFGHVSVFVHIHRHTYKAGSTNYLCAHCQCRRMQSKNSALTANVLKEKSHHLAPKHKLLC